MCETRKRIEIKQIAWRIIKPTNVVIISTSVILNCFPFTFCPTFEEWTEKTDCLRWAP